MHRSLLLPCLPYFSTLCSAFPRLSFLPILRPSAHVSCLPCTSLLPISANAKLANCWSSPEAGEIFKVRGSSYLHDRVKQPSARAVFELAESDLFGVHSVEPMNHVVKNLPNNCVQRAAAMEDGRFYIVVVIQAPGELVCSFLPFILSVERSRGCMSGHYALLPKTKASPILG